MAEGIRYLASRRRIPLDPSQGHRLGKTALVLAGGGLTGAVYEIGALRAIDDLLLDRTVNDFDIYVGTSAGALVGSLLANGFSPQTMLESLAGDSEIPAIALQDIFRLNLPGLLRSARRVPRTLFRAGKHFLRNRREMTLFDLAWSLSEALPSGFYDPEGIARYLERVISQYGRSNDFRKLACKLCVIATDLDNGERVVFDRESDPPVPISLAVAGSTALPILYRPMRIGDHDYVDGGIRGNASLDLAIENGATLVICINPLVPFDNSDRKAIPFLGPDGGYLSEKGLASIGSQVGRIGSHGGLHYHIKQLWKTHPEVDIIVVEPARDDYAMFLYNIMRYSVRMIVARHGFESVTLRLAEDYDLYKETLARHGIPISRRLVIEELNEIRESNYDPAVIRRVLEARSGARRNTIRTPAAKLSRTLASLEALLDELSEASFPEAGSPPDH